METVLDTLGCNPFVQSSVKQETPFVRTGIPFRKGGEDVNRCGNCGRLNLDRVAKRNSLDSTNKKEAI